MASHNFKVGDTVKLIDVFEGWDDCWKHLVGKPIKVVKVHGCWIVCNVSKYVPQFTTASFEDKRLALYDAQLMFNFMY